MRINVEPSISGDWGKIGVDVRDGDRLQVRNAGQQIEGQFGPQFVFKVMNTKKKEFNIAFNKTSRNNLARVFGGETEDWLKKVIKAFVVKQMVGEGLKNVLYLAPEGWEMNEDGEFFNPAQEDEPKANLDPKAIDDAMDDEVSKGNPF